MESTSIVKALALLESTASEPLGRSLGALAAEVGLAKPTAHRILKTLTALGYLERSEQGVYRQTPHVQRLVSNDRTGQILAQAGPVLRKLHDATQETVNLGILRNDRIVYLQVLESPQPLRRVATPNSVDTFYTTALGRAIVSCLPDAQREELLRRVKLEPLTPHSNINRTALTGILDQAREDGYALEVDETDVGVTCIGAPVLDGGVPVAAISISVPTARATGDALPRLIDQVRAAARQVTRRVEFPDKPTQRTLSKRPVRRKRSEASS